jgi:hypothetical protein
MCGYRCANSRAIASCACWSGRRASAAGGLGPGLTVLFGAYDLVSRVSVLAAVPVFVWETSLSAYLLLRGFRPSPLLDRPARVERAVVPA